MSIIDGHYPSPTCDIRVTTQTPDRLFFPMIDLMEATIKASLEPAMSLGHLFRNRERVSRWIVSVVGMRNAFEATPLTVAMDATTLAYMPYIPSTTPTGLPMPLQLRKYNDFFYFSKLNFKLIIQIILRSIFSKLLT